MITLTLQDSGRTIEVKTYDSVVVRLVEDSTSGDCWTLGSRSGLAVTDDRLESEDGTCSARMRVFEVSPRRTGVFQLSIGNSKKSGDEKMVVDRFTVTLIAL